MRTMRNIPMRPTNSRLRDALQEEEELRTQARERSACSRCHKPLSFPLRRVLCAVCGTRVCRSCSEHNPVKQAWTCPTCSKHREVHQQSGEWFYQQVRRRFYPTAIPGGKNDNGLGMDPDTNQVREFIERLVETLVSGGLDDVNVNRLYLHPEYKPVPEGDSPSEAHAALKQLVQRIINEAMTLPKLQELSKLSNGDSLQSESVTAEEMASKTYEDILATAILNKVIERFQQYTVGVSSQSPVDSNSNLLRHKEFQPQFISRLEIGMSGGSDSDVTRSTLELDTASWSGSEPMSLTIEECVETTMYDTSDEDGIPEEKDKATSLDYFLSGLNFIKCHRVPFPELGMDLVDGPGSEGELGEDEESLESNASPQPTDLLSPIDSWEENWLFQRRRLKASRGANQPMSVPMLVPNPSEDFRALIGDRDAEEISDLSECSDSALEDLVCEVETAEDGQVSGEYASLQGGDPELAETRNLELSVDCLSEFGQQDSEYTEDYASVTRRQLNSLTRLHEPEEVPKPVPKPRTLGIPLQVCVGDEPSFETSPEDSNIDQSQMAIELSTPPRPGTIAEREHKKWESAPPLANNPYSSENISKRLHRKLQYNSHSNTAEVSKELPEFQNEPIVPKMEEQSPKVLCADNDLNFERYGRDYYINNSKFASGQRRYQAQPVSVEIVSSNVQQAQSPQETDACGPLDARVTTPEGTEQTCHHVGTKVAWWQKEINETEEQWLKKLQPPGKPVAQDETSPGPPKPTGNLNLIPNGDAEDPKEQIPNGQTNSEVTVCDAETLELRQEAKTNIIVKNCRLFEPKQQLDNTNVVSSHKHYVEKHAKKSMDLAINSKNDQELIKSKIIESKELEMNGKTKMSDCMNSELVVEMNGDKEMSGQRKNSNKKWEMEMARSEGSITSSEGEASHFLPSVKELAKHFSGGAESDSSSSTSKGPSMCCQSKNLCGEKKVVIIAKEDREATGKPVRQVHSLTARSISREFREGLRRNLPVQLDRNLHSMERSDPNSDLELRQHKGGSYDTTPGYTSDESGTVSPIPATHKLRSNIEFWEQLQNSK